MKHTSIYPLLGLLGALLFIGGTAVACELPAEPVAAIVPLASELDDGSGDGKVRIVNNPDGTFEFLVPDNTQINMRIAWDPYDHNGGRLQGKYDWVARPDKGNIPVDTSLPVITDSNGPHGYFPLEKMAQFFTVTGNRGSIMEAFNRSVGNTPSNQFMAASGMTPKMMLANAFVKPGQQGKISILDGQQTTEYPAVSTFCSPSGADLEMDQINPVLPNDGSEFSPKSDSRDYDKDSKKYRKLCQYLYGTSGMYMGELNIGLTTLKNEDYKAYIVAGEPNVWMGSTLPILPEGSNGGVGNTTGEISIKFPTPTLGATEPIKLKVNAPSAGFEITNLFWCWEEQVETKVASDTDDDGVLDTYIHDSADPECGIRRLKCSVGLKVTVVKPASGSGFSAFRVYNTRQPIASRLEVGTPPDYTATPTFTCGESGISVPFRMTVYGSDPFANISLLPRVDSFGNTIDLKHDVPGMLNSVKLFISYPVYTFKPASGIEVNDFYNLQKVNLGLMDFEDPKAPRWKGTYYEQKWVWMPANSVTITAANMATLEADGSTALGGAAWTIEGTAVFNVPVPQHFSNDGSGKSLYYKAHTPEAEYPAPGNPAVEKLWKIFAITQDTSGFKSESYDAVVAAIDPATVRESAGQVLDSGVVLPDVPATVLKKAYNQSPPLETRIPSDIPMAGGEYAWQKYAYLACTDDNTPPEIELILFDTRNNRYHIFGTKAGGDGKIADSSPSFSAYQQSSPAPYSSADNTLIDNALKFEAYEEALYARFIDTLQAGGASAITETALAGNGFVCQANTRLIFYIRAWDNMNTFSDTKHFGVEKISYEVKDENKASADTPPSVADAAYDPQDLMQNPPVWQFRAPNVSGGAPDGKECSITVKAKDYSGAERTLVLKVFVVGNDLTIRSLEEKRNRN